MSASHANHSSTSQQTVMPDIPADELLLDFSLRRTTRASRKSSPEKSMVPASPKDSVQEISSNYFHHVESFSTSMCYLVEYIHQAGSKARESLNANFAEIYRTLIDMIFEAKGCKKKTSEEIVLHFSKRGSTETIDVVVPLVDHDDWRTILQYANAANAAPRILAESMIQQIVNTWEHLLGSLIATRIDSNALKNNRNIHASFSELCKLKDVCEIKKVFIDKVVREFLRKNIDDQLSTLNAEYKVDAISSFSKVLLSDLKETIARRHAVVHCNSIATPEYCERVKELGKEPPSVGEELISTTKYLLHAWDVFFAAGMIVSNLFYVSHARLLKSKDMESDANGLFVTESHTALSHNRNESARIMLQYANEKTIYGDWPRLATKINLALAYKRMNRMEDCLKVLGEYNWNFSDDPFKAAVAALRDNNKEAIKIICKICRNNRDFLKSAYDWVVFEGVRKDGAFIPAMEKLLSKEGKTMVRVPAPAVHLTKHTDEKAMLKKLYDAASKFSQTKLS